MLKGMEDPISNSKCKLAMLNEHCVGILTREIDAGDEYSLFIQLNFGTSIYPVPDVPLFASYFIDDSGHCPHDEVPELVNSILCEWIVEVEDKLHHIESCQ